MLKNSKPIEYAFNGFTGKGTIVGVVGNEQPIIGLAYIVRDDSGNFPSEKYQYSCFVCLECWLKLIGGNDENH